MFGLLSINKPTGWTSREVVDRVQLLVRPAKAGHAGTLDPLARGVLVVCVGPATRLIPYIQQMRKHYRASFLLGRESDTEDIQGNVVQLDNPRPPSRPEIEEVLGQFLGEISQRPPCYSALKVKGQRAYRLARAGKPVQLAPRTVTIDDLQIVSYAYPQLQLDIQCGSGTYVRSLGRDIALALGTAAVMSALTRTAIGSFRLEQTTDVQTLADRGPARFLLPAGRATQALPQIELSPDEIERIKHGRTIENQTGSQGPEIAAVAPSGQLLAILTPRGPGRLGPMRNFIG